MKWQYCHFPSHFAFSSTQSCSAHVPFIHLFCLYNEARNGLKWYFGKHTLDISHSKTLGNPPPPSFALKQWFIIIKQYSWCHFYNMASPVWRRILTRGSFFLVKYWTGSHFSTLNIESWNFMKCVNLKLWKIFRKVHYTHWPHCKILYLL